MDAPVVATGMNTGDWVTVGAVLVALLIGAASLLQTNRMARRRDRRDCLMQVVEWAMTVLEAGRAGVLVGSQRSVFGDPSSHVRVKEGPDTRAALNVSEQRSEYVERMASLIDRSVGDSVKACVDRIRAHQDVLKTGMGIGEGKTLDDDREVLDASARSVISLCVKLLPGV